MSEKNTQNTANAMHMGSYKLSLHKLLKMHETHASHFFIDIDTRTAWRWMPNEA